MKSRRDLNLELSPYLKEDEIEWENLRRAGSLPWEASEEQKQE